MTITLYGRPITKKNSMQIIKLHNRPCIVPSKQYKQYETDCIRQMRKPAQPMSGRYNVKCVYYMPTRRRVDLCNLIEASCDILVKGGVLSDDNCGVVCSHDGSRVAYDKDNPRAVITITEVYDEDT